jgi:hypothetical protein
VLLPCESRVLAAGNRISHVVPLESLGFLGPGCVAPSQASSLSMNGTVGRVTGIPDCSGSGGGVVVVVVVVPPCL